MAQQSRHKRTWLQKLHPLLRRHLKEDAKVHSRAALQRTVNWQAERGMDCWECRRAASDAGLTAPDVQPTPWPTVMGGGTA
jgi:hypothetical protein